MSYTYLALGDSYTIGEGVPLHESFPYQLVQMLRNEGLTFLAPEIVAQTGWTTAELLDHLSKTKLYTHYDFVTLLIGVNNQYRGLSADDYKKDFEMLLKKARSFAKEDSGVIVLSIPHWGMTPFAADRDTAKIEAEIDLFNSINKSMAVDAGIQYIDIAEGTKEVVNNGALLTKDNLHYSGVAHGGWAKEIAAVIEKVIALNG